MKKTDESLSLNRVLAFPVLTGLAAVLLCIALLSLSWFSEPVSLPQLAVNSAVALLAAFLGAFIGSRRRRRKRRRKS